MPEIASDAIHQVTRLTEDRNKWIDANRKLGVRIAELEAQLAEAKTELEKERYLAQRLEEARSKQPDWEKLWAEAQDQLSAQAQAGEALRAALAMAREDPVVMGYLLEQEALELAHAALTAARQAGG